jgi:hypothetical protein
VTVLENLITSESAILVALVSARRPPATDQAAARWDNRPTWDNWAKTPAPFDNRPTWDNWNKQPKKK